MAHTSSVSCQCLLFFKVLQTSDCHIISSSRGHLQWVAKFSVQCSLWQSHRALLSALRMWDAYILHISCNHFCCRQDWGPWKWSAAWISKCIRGCKFPVGGPSMHYVVDIVKDNAHKVTFEVNPITFTKSGLNLIWSFGRKLHKKGSKHWTWLMRHSLHQVCSQSAEHCAEMDCLNQDIIVAGFAFILNVFLLNDKSQNLMKFHCLSSTCSHRSYWI